MGRSNIENLLWNIVLGAKTRFCGNSHIYMLHSIAFRTNPKKILNRASEVSASNFCTAVSRLQLYYSITNKKFKNFQIWNQNRPFWIQTVQSLIQPTIKYIKEIVSENYRVSASELTFSNGDVTMVTPEAIIRELFNKDWNSCHNLQYMASSLGWHVKLYTKNYLQSEFYAEWFSGLYTIHH